VAVFPVFYKGFGFRDLPSLPAKRSAEVTDHPIGQRFRAYGEEGRAEIAQPFRGLTADGRVVPNLFPIASTGASTKPIFEAAQGFLASLDSGQRARATFGVDAPEWRAWSNIHPFILRHGVVLDDCTPTQRERALGIVRASCSTRGFALARDVMRLNAALGELTGRPTEYGEWYYWFSIFGEPSESEPWGWQIDGHHLIVNCFILGDQLVMTPNFFGSEPTAVDTGKHAGTRVFVDEEQRGLQFARGLAPGQRAKAIPESTEGVLRAQRMDGRIQTPAFRDNIDLPYAGVLAKELSTEQRVRLLDLIEIYTGRTRDDHARVKLEQIEQHLDQTRFLWVGGLEDDSVFYYRIHSPVVLIEFDHLPGIAFDNDEPSRNHIHTVVRTPNGNDYGKDVLRQHWARHHAPTAASAR
jgi:Protein of unknown function (DUF3500)